MPDNDMKSVQPDNQQIIDALENQKESGEDQGEASEEYKKYLIFKIGDKKFAIEAFLIREIVLDLKIFFLPFVPPYVRGVVNRHGDPYTVIDVNILFYQKKLEAGTFLMLSDADNPASLLISDVVEIIKVPVSEIDYINDTSEDKIFFRGVLKNQGNDVLIDRKSVV
jgi:chemotaxis signal transduction protein